MQTWQSANVVISAVMADYITKTVTNKDFVLSLISQVYLHGGFNTTKSVNHLSPNPIFPSAEHVLVASVVF
jgi:hypothetical protein